MVAVMAARQPPALAPSRVVEIGEVSCLVEDRGGGRVFVHGELVYAWDADDEPSRRLAAVQLVRMKAARAVQVASGFGVTPQTLRRWEGAETDAGAAGLVAGKRGPRGPTRLTEEVVTDIRARRQTGAALRTIATAVGVCEASVRRALSQPGRAATPGPVTVAEADRAADPPALPDPVFAPAGRVPLVGLLLAVPALAATGLLDCATGVFRQLPNEFPGLETMLVEAVLRALAREPRAERATRIDPVALGRVLGLDRAPEVQTIRREITALAASGRAEDFLAALARRQVVRREGADPGPAAVLYVDGHVRAYQVRGKTAQPHLARLGFPAPATVRTWVADAAGDPVLVVVARPGAPLSGQLRQLLPELRKAVGDQRRVLVGFDHGGWSPALFAHMAAHGFDVLTWRKGPVADVEEAQFAGVIHHDGAGPEHRWRAADTTVDLLAGEAGDVFTMRQVTLSVAKDAHGSNRHGQASTRQIHILTTRTDLAVGDVIYRMGARWRQENYFRYARMHFDPDPAGLREAEADPGRQVRDIQITLITNAIRIAAFNAATALARTIRVDTGSARASHEARRLARQALAGSGDIDPRDGTLTVRLDPLPTQRATAAIAELCGHLTATNTCYPGSTLVLRYEVKTRP
jgi:prepilin-type processing-associated H-X9-DG protein